MAWAGSAGCRVTRAARAGRAWGAARGRWGDPRRDDAPTGLGRGMGMGRLGTGESQRGASESGGGAERTGASAEEKCSTWQGGMLHVAPRRQ